MCACWGAPVPCQEPQPAFAKPGVPMQALPLTHRVTTGKPLPLSDPSCLPVNGSSNPVLGKRNIRQGAYVIVSFPITTLRKVFKGKSTSYNIFIKFNIAQMLFQHVTNIKY